MGQKIFFYLTTLHRSPVFPARLILLCSAQAERHDDDDDDGGGGGGMVDGW